MLSSFKNSPLWIIGLFIIFAQGTASLAAVRITGWEQSALVIFVISYSSGVTLIFFLFLWCKPENFYAPSEFADINPDDFVNALKGLPEGTKEAAINYSRNPEEIKYQFELIDSLLDESDKQHLIFMRENNGFLDISNTTDAGTTHSFDLLSTDENIMQSGRFSPSRFSSRLEGTDLINISADKMQINLSQKGKKFTDWLMDNGKKAESFKTDMGGWGEEVTHENFVKKVKENRKE